MFFAALLFTPLCAALSPVSLVLLQHINELTRQKTATGDLINDERMRAHASIQTVNWASGEDNERVVALISDLASPALVWTDEDNTEATAAAAGACPSFVLLDGTWDDARQLFCEGPACLRALPRITLPPAESTFWLRNRGSSQVPSGAVCTAEAAAGKVETVRPSTALHAWPRLSVSRAIPIRRRA